MKAMVLNAVGESPVLTEVDQPNLKEGEVLVKLKAAALNHRVMLVQSTSLMKKLRRFLWPD